MLSDKKKKEQHSSLKRLDSYIYYILYPIICHTFCPETVEAFSVLLFSMKNNAVDMWHLHHWNDPVQSLSWGIMKGKKTRITIHRFVTCSYQTHCWFLVTMYRIPAQKAHACHQRLEANDWLLHSCSCFVQEGQKGQGTTSTFQSLMA